MAAEPAADAVRRLEQQVVWLQRGGQHIEAISVFEKAVQLRIDSLGDEHPETVKSLERLCAQYNSVAMTTLHQGESRVALALLTKAADLCQDAALESLVPLYVQSLNNLACCHRRMGKPRTALRVLQHCLRVCEEREIEESLGVAHLNCCAVLSELGRHKEAAQHAQTAILHCQEALLSDSIRAKLAGEGGADLLTEKIVVLGIAYHNLAVELEFLGRRAESLEWYRKALRLAREHLGEDEGVTQMFRCSLDEARHALPRKASPQRRPQSARAPRPARPRTRRA